MRQRRFANGKEIRNAGARLKAMGTCRKVLIEATAGVKPCGVMFHGCEMVTAAIDDYAIAVRPILTVAGECLTN